MASKPAPIPKPLARDAVALAMEFHRRRPWLWCGDHSAFAVRLPSASVPWFVSVLGAAGQQFGLACYAGGAGLRQLRDIVFVHDDDSRTLRCDTLAITVSPQREIAEPLRDVYRAAGHDGRWAPSFVWIGAYQPPRPARKPELRHAVAILRAFLAADDRDLLRPSVITPSGAARLLTLDATGDDLRVCFETWEADADELRSCVSADPELGALPRVEARWAVGFRVTPARVADDPRPIFALLVMDLGADRVLLAKVVPGEDVAGAAAHVTDLMRTGSAHSAPGRPRTVDFTSRLLHDALAPVLTTADVATRFVPEEPLLDAAFEAMFGAVRDPDTDADSGQAVAQVLSRLLDEVTRRAAANPRRRAEFLGDDDDPAAKPDRFSTLALVWWLALDHRPSARHRTLAERVLAGDLPDAEREVLRAIVEATPSLYRVEHADDGGTRVADLFSGRPTAGFDDPVLDHAEVGTVLGGRICTAADEVFAVWLTPPIPVGLVTQALQHLETIGLELSPAGLARAPHLLGRVHPWLAARLRAGPPAVTNTDGDPLRLQRATFVCADPAAARDALAARDDVDAESDDGPYVWFRAGGDARRTSLARIEPIGDELLVEVNSDARLAAVSLWLEAIPGVRFERVREIEMGPGALRGPGPQVASTPDAIAAVQEFLNAHYRNWVDEPVPALGGLTPREAVKTPAGRRQVELLIATMPDMPDLPGVGPPRREIRRELGLEQGE